MVLICYKSRSPSLTWISTGNAHHASQSTFLDQPSYQTGEVNTLPVVQFNGATGSQYLEDSMTYSARTVFIVYRVSSVFMNNGDLGQLWGNYAEGVQVAVEPRAISPRGWSFDGAGSGRMLIQF